MMALEKTIIGSRYEEWGKEKRGKKIDRMWDGWYIIKYSKWLFWQFINCHFISSYYKFIVISYVVKIQNPWSYSYMVSHSERSPCVMLWRRPLRFTWSWKQERSKEEQKRRRREEGEKKRDEVWSKRIEERIKMSIKSRSQMK